MLRIYLAGNAFETEYRSIVKSYYGSKFILVDPMVENGAIIDKENTKVIHNGSFEDVVINDKALIEGCDILTAVFNKHSTGTIMEILYAYNRNIPVYLIIPPSKGFENDIWLKYHTTRFFYNTEFCYDYILEQKKYTSS